MPKLRQIPFLHEKPLADGKISYEWKPSKTAKAGGWCHVVYGTDEAAAIIAAKERNREYDKWKAAGKPAHGVHAVRPAVTSFEMLVARYRQHSDYLDLKPSSQKEYDSRLGWLTTWADKGRKPVVQISEQDVSTLRERLLKEGSKYRTGAILRVLRLLLSFAERQQIIPQSSNPAMKCRIPEPSARRNNFDIKAIGALSASAMGCGLPNASLALQLGFWTLQRQSDLVRLNRFAWRDIVNLDPAHAEILAGPGGTVKGFRINQGKTGVWVDAPVPPVYHPAIDRAFKKSDCLLLDDQRAIFTELTTWRLQRQFKRIRNLASIECRNRGDITLADVLANGQFRDLRRSGMMYMRDKGAQSEWITALSGHNILERKSILDTYMPGDTPAACAAVATAWQAYQQSADNQLTALVAI